MIQKPTHTTPQHLRCSVLSLAMAPLLFVLFFSVPCSSAEADSALLYAQSLSDASQALELYKKIASDKTAPDSIRSEAWFRLGCASYMRGRYSKAAGYFKKAAGATDNPMYKQAYYLNSIRDTTDTMFIKTLTNEAKDTVLHLGKTANFYCGLYYYSKKDFRQALTHFRASIDSSGNPSLLCSAYSGIYGSAAALSQPALADSALAAIKKSGSSYLERVMLARLKLRPDTTVQKDTLARKDTTAWIKSDTSAKKADTISKPVPPVRKTGFSCQVGAFSTMENAQARKTGLLKDYQTVEISSGAAGNKTVYRVRVGAFDSKEAAQAFGDSVLVKKGISFRVVEE